MNILPPHQERLLGARLFRTNCVITFFTFRRRVVAICLPRHGNTVPPILEEASKYLDQTSFTSHSFSSLEGIRPSQNSCFKNSTLKKDSLLLIAHTAAQQEIAHLQHAWDLYESIPHEVSNDVKETAIALVYNDYNKHSVVAYNVGYHKDIFNGKMPSLENKAVFSIHSDSRKGRGGSDGNYFHYALLDWGNRQVTRRRFLLDRNAIRPEQQATQSTLEDYFAVNPEHRALFNQALASVERRRRARNRSNNNNNNN